MVAGMKAEWADPTVRKPRIESANNATVSGNLSKRNEVVLVNVISISMSPWGLGGLRHRHDAAVNIEIRTSKRERFQDLLTTIYRTIVAMRQYGDYLIKLPKDYNNEYEYDYNYFHGTLTVNVSYIA